MCEGHPAASSLMRSALKRLYALGPGKMLPGRERLSRLLERAGNPHLAVPSILVGGTNGKGRVVAALSAALSRCYSTGAFLKPHLTSIRQRWRINDQDLTADQFSNAAHQACDLIEENAEEISFFEANVLLGALLFKQAGCEIAVWEVGLGGRHDACNLVEPMVSVLTNVGWDHQSILGNTLAEIAQDKAWIARAGQPLILGPCRPGWEADYADYAPVVAKVAAEIGANLHQLEPASQADWDEWLLAASGLPPDSGAMVRACLNALADQGFPGEPGAIEQGTAAIRYRARLERTWLQGRPVLLDAAHNVDSLRWLAAAVPRILPHAKDGLTVLFGCQASRDPAELLGILKPITRQLVPIEIPVLKPCPASQLILAANELSIPVALPDGISWNDLPVVHDIGLVTELDPPDNRTHWIECTNHALTFAGETEPLLICGSIYYLGEILRAFEERAQNFSQFAAH